MHGSRTCLGVIVPETALAQVADTGVNHSGDDCAGSIEHGEHH